MVYPILSRGNSGRTPAGTGLMVYTFEEETE
jgi:hypothetical protein